MSSLVYHELSQSLWDLQKVSTWCILLDPAVQPAGLKQWEQCPKLGINKKESGKAPRFYRRCIRAEKTQRVSDVLTPELLRVCSYWTSIEAVLGEGWNSHRTPALNTAQNEERVRLSNRDTCLLLRCYHLLSAKNRKFHNNFLTVTLRPGKICLNIMLMLALRELLHLFPKKRINQKNNTPIHPREQWNASLSIWLFCWQA